MGRQSKTASAALSPKSKLPVESTVLRRRPFLTNERTFAASSAKTHLLQLLDEVDSGRHEVIITKRGRPVARLVPMEVKSSSSIFGCMKGTGRITGDIVEPEPDIWEAMTD